MSQVAAFCNGQFVPASEVTVPIYDQGFVQGVTVSEQLRTFNGQLFRLDEHLRRLERSLQVVNVETGFSFEELRAMCLELAARNHRLLAEGDDLGLCLFVTPGPYPNFAASPDVVPESDRRPRVVAHTFPMPFRQWAEKYSSGQDLSISTIREVPTSCWPAELKCRSRMHYYLADLEAERKYPGSRAVLLDQEGAVVEASTANVFIYLEDEGFVAPPTGEVLPGISLQTLEEIAGQLEVPFVRRRLMPQELFDADELLLCSTSPCVLPVCCLDGESIGEGKPGPQFQRLIDAWSELVGLNVVEQATRVASTR